MGKPDIGLMSSTETLMIARNMAKSVDIPVIADIEDGYGNAVNAMYIVERFEEAGIAGVHIDDQTSPCRCPFLPGLPRAKLLSIEQMCGKIRAMVKARKDPDFLIIPRPNVIGTVSLEQYYKDNLIEEVVRRGNAYAKAGADAIFVMGFTPEELSFFARSIDAPLVGIFSGVEPIALNEFEKLGYKIVISSTITLYAAAKGMKEGLKSLKETRDWNAIQDKLIKDDELFDIVKVKNLRPIYKEFNVK